MSPQADNTISAGSWREVGRGEPSRDPGVLGQDAPHHFCDGDVPSSRTESSRYTVPKAGPTVTVGYELWRLGF